MKSHLLRVGLSGGVSLSFFFFEFSVASAQTPKDTLPTLHVSSAILAGRTETIRVIDNQPMAVGGYTVMGGRGYAFGSQKGSLQKKPLYAPLVMRTRPGRVIKFDLINNSTRAGAGASHGTDATQQNIHLHGLDVSPCTRVGKEGDNVLVIINSVATPAAISGNHAHVAAAPKGGCGAGQIGTVVTQRHYEIRVPKTHDRGLFWYHPHIHGQAEGHVLSGLSGLLDLGNICEGNALGKNSAERKRICDGAEPRLRQRMIMLKDIQIGEVSGKNAKVLQAYNKTLCDFVEDASPNLNWDAVRGECLDKAATTPDAKLTASRWVFTLNGAKYPTLVMQAGKQEIWRLANTSADVTYRLSLIDDAGADVPFQILSLDGMYLPGRKIQTRLDMMPGTRAELLITSGTIDANGKVRPFDANRRFRLVQHAVSTGGDDWPQIALAEIHGLGKRGAAPLGPGVIALEANEFTLRTTAARLELPGAARTIAGTHVRPPECGSNKLATVVFDDGWSIPSGSDTAKPPSGSKGRALVEIGLFVEPDDSMKISTGVAAKKPVDMTGVDLCVEQGAEVQIKISNQSGELHNFHIHQGRFTVEALFDPLKAGKKGRIASMAHYVHELEFKGNKLPVRHDSVPVPINGSATIAMQFQQQGRFVYHCHILEHEDKGMMAVAHVFAPRGGGSK